MTVFSSLALVPIPFLVTGVGSPWLESCLALACCPLRALATAPAKTHGQSRAICEQASQTPSAPFILGAVPAQTLLLESSRPAGTPQNLSSELCQ